MLPNLGEKRFVAVAGRGIEKEMTAQVCDVNKPLLSVKRAVQANNRVVFDADGSYVECKKTGQKLWLKEVGGMYMLRLWVRKNRGQGFQRRG